MSMKKPELSQAQTRALTLRALARLHCGLLAAIVFASVFALLPAMTIQVRISPEEAFWRGLLFAIPTALCWYAIKRLPAMWQFLLATALLCGLSWLLTGHIGGAVLTLLMCVLRLRVRLAEEEEGPTRSLFDNPSFFGLALYLLIFVISAIVGVPSLQRLSLLGAVLYFLVCLGFKGLERLDHYLTINHAMHDLPARRIQRVAGAAVAASVAIAAILLLPLALTNEGNTRIVLPDKTYLPSAANTDGSEFLAEQGDGQMDYDLTELYGKPTWQIPAFVTNIILGAISLVLAVAIATSVLRLLKDFRRSYTDSRDYVQYLAKDDPDAGESYAGDAIIRKPRLLDRSPNATIRRRYRKAILKAAQEPPEQWMSPREAESHARLDAPALHRLYEKARYGPEPCSAADLKEIH